jgi:hypothetical protein
MDHSIVKVTPSKDFSAPALSLGFFKGGEYSVGLGVFVVVVVGGGDGNGCAEASELKLLMLGL